MSSSEAEIIGGTLDTFCTVYRGKDWSILETKPVLECPLEEETNDTTIKTYLGIFIQNILEDNNYQWNQDEHDSIFIDTLYALTRIVDSCNLLLPENWHENQNCDNLEDLKIEQFQRRVTKFHQEGANFVHWFSAWRYQPYNFPWQPDEWGPCDPDCNLPGSGPWEIGHTLTGQAQKFPMNILHPEYPDSMTPLAYQMHVYVPPDNPRRYTGDLSDVSGAMRISNHPNVFNSRTRIEYYLSRSGDARLEIYDLMGKRIAILFNEFKEAGEHYVIWNADEFASGVYFCVLTQERIQATQKMALVK